MADLESGTAAPPPDLFIGVDGGGSRCRVRIRDRSRRLLGAAEGGAANVSLDLNGAVGTIRETIATAFGSAGLDASAFARAAVGLGLAGASSAEVGDRVRAGLPAFQHATVVHDGLIACLGAHGGRDGGLVIAGTGSAAVLWLNGQASSIGGRGFLLGDDGSGAWIGRKVWRLALRACDGLEPGSPFLDELLADFDRDIVKVIAWARRAPSHAFAAYAPRVLAAAGAGDAAASKIAGAAGEAIGELIAALAARGAPRIALVGGLAAAVTPYLRADLRARIEPPLADALEGALLMAGLPLAPDG